MKEFAQNGYTGVTTMSISERAGFSEKTLFRKFKTKKIFMQRFYFKIISK